jgi:hypothetical protein
MAPATTDSAVSGFGIPDGMKVICLYLLATTAVLMSGPQDCYRIQNRDSQNSCLAMAKGEKQYCYRIRNRDQQNMCLAQVPREKQYCYRTPIAMRRIAASAWCGSERSERYRIGVLA